MVGDPTQGSKSSLGAQGDRKVKVVAKKASKLSVYDKFKQRQTGEYFNG
jgi:hypothetical protein